MMFIRADLDTIERMNAMLLKQYQTLAREVASFHGLPYQLDPRIAGRRNIMSRIRRAAMSMVEIQREIHTLKNFIARSIEQYRTTERTIEGKMDPIVPPEACSAQPQEIAEEKGNSDNLAKLEEGKESVTYAEAQLIALQITSQYEGGQVTGNFDGMGLSLGYLQWNIGMGTLQPLLKAMAEGSESKADFDKIFSAQIKVGTENGKDIYRTQAEILREVLAKSKAEQLQWAKTINTDKNKIIEPWKSSFEQLVENEHFIAIEEEAAQYYWNTAKKIVEQEYGVKSVRGLALAFDIAVQNGSVKTAAATMAMQAINGESTPLTNPNDESLTPNQRKIVEDMLSRIQSVDDEERHKLYYLAAAVAINGGNDKYRWDSWIRKATIVAGEGTVHGTKLDLDRDFGLSDLPIK